MSIPRLSAKSSEQPRPTLLTQSYEQQTLLNPQRAKFVAPAPDIIWASIANFVNAAAGAFAGAGLASSIPAINPILAVAVTIICSIVGALASTWQLHGNEKRRKPTETVLVSTILYGGASLSFLNTVMKPTPEWLTLVGPLGFPAWLAGVVSQFSIGARQASTTQAGNQPQPESPNLWERVRTNVSGRAQAQNFYDTLLEVMRVNPTKELGPAARGILEHLVQDRLRIAPSDEAALRVKAIMNASPFLDVSDGLVLVSQLLNV